jgi:predicted Ser/Thr protein kinase
MITQYTQALQNNWRKIPFFDFLPNAEDFLYTKFSQPLVWADRKVLFLVTYKQHPLCIIKTVRDAVYNRKLQHEKNIQETLTTVLDGVIAKVYFDVHIDGRYTYFEEFLNGVVLSKIESRKRESEIVSLIATFPTSGSLSVECVIAIFSKYITEKKSQSIELFDILGKSTEPFVKGYTNSDLGRTNILAISNSLYIIDWERANERPVWLIDAVYFMTRTRGIQTLDEWQKRAQKDFSKYTGVSLERANALYALLALFETVYRESPKKYSQLISELF